MNNRDSILSLPSPEVGLRSLPIRSLLRLDRESGFSGYCKKDPSASDRRPQMDERNGSVEKSKESEGNRSRRKLAMLKRSGLFGQETLGVRIERACSLDDLREAYRLVHEVYAQTGYIRPEPCRLRMRMFETSPEMATFIAKVDGRVVGVISIIGDSPELGLPSDAAFKADLDALRVRGARLCEATNQVVIEKYRKSAVATELMRCAVAHLTTVGYGEVVATVCPSHYGFYQLMNFRQVGTERSYSDKIHDPVVALSMDANQYRRSASGLDEAGQFMHHFMAAGNHFLKHVGRWEAEAQRCFLKRDLLRRLFITETAFITSCSGHELHVLERQWGHKLFASVTGISTVAAARNWVSAFLNVLHLLDDESALGGVKVLQ